MILVINCGSQSIKWKLFSKKIELVFQRKKEYFSLASAQKAIKKEFQYLKKLKDKIKIVAHRVVWGRFFEPQEINQEVLKEIKFGFEIAPLHNPFQFLGIKIAKREFKQAQHFAVFDTQFFKDLPLRTRIYPLKQEILEKYQIFKLGFHGLSHQYLLEKTAQLLKKPLKKINVITIHLGGGASITAIKNGRPIETSMGFSPLEGLVMMTRSGNLDPGLLLFLFKRINLKRLTKILNQESGLKAIAGQANFKKLEFKKTPQAKLALELFVLSLQKYLYSYYGLLKEVEAIVFGGTIGFKSKKIRDLVLKNFPFKKPKIFALETNEEYQIAKEILCSKKIKFCL